MASKKTVIINGKLKSVSSQRTPYKPYGYELEFDKTYVRLEVPQDAVLSEHEGNIILSLDGLNHILQVTADSVDKLHNNYLKQTGG